MAKKAEEKAPPANKREEVADWLGLEREKVLAVGRNDQGIRILIKQDGGHATAHHCTEAEFLKSDEAKASIAAEYSQGRSG